jgi:predicted N-acyltransferase
VELAIEKLTIIFCFCHWITGSSWDLMHRLEASWLERHWGQGYVTKQSLEAAARLLASTLISSMCMVAMHGQPDACVVLLIAPRLSFMSCVVCTSIFI